MTFRLSHTKLLRTTGSPVIGKVRLFSTSRAVLELRASGRPLQCHVGVSFASKDSPPFSTREEADISANKGFQTGPIARWKDQMLGLGTLRTELLKTGSEEGKELSDVEQAKQVEAVISDRKRWGAGEDFFFTRQGVCHFAGSYTAIWLIFGLNRSGRSGE
jgi:hypothetical protein